MPWPSHCRTPARCCALRPGPASSFWDARRLHPERSLRREMRERTWERGAGWLCWARWGLLASAASPSLLLSLLLHGPQTAEGPRAPAPAAKRPAEESCCPNLREWLPHSSSGRTRKWRGRWSVQWEKEGNRGKKVKEEGERVLGESVQGL